MDLELKDKVAIIGGASKGLGRACADVLAEEGKVEITQICRDPCDTRRGFDVETIDLELTDD